MNLLEIYKEIICLFLSVSQGAERRVSGCVPHPEEERSDGAVEQRRRERSD